MRYGRGTIAATLLATLLVPASGTLAGDKAELNKTERRLEQVRNDIEELSAEAKTKAARVDALNRSITKLQIEVNDLDEKVVKIEAEVRDAQARIDELQAKADKIQKAAMKQAVSLYKLGVTETFDALLNSQSLSDLDAQVEMLGVASQEKTGALIRFSRVQVEIREQSAELFAKKDELTATLKSRSKLLALQQEQTAELAAKVAEIRAELGIKKSKESHFEEERDAIKAQILENQAKAEVAALGTSNEGFIWPLNGGVTSYYGPRWGRMHTGIDIDGYTGQPIVAAKEGRVILASYYSGYGNAVIVDHGGGYSTLYAHMSSFNTSNGASVDQGDILGYVGCTGSCTGDHLHFEVRVNGNPVDPMPYMP